MRSLCELTPCTSAPLLEPLTLATVPSMFTSDLCRLTSCVVPKDEEAGRFSPDILTKFRRISRDLVVGLQDIAEWSRRTEVEQRSI